MIILDHTYSGKIYKLLHPQVDDIDIRDIAHHLARQCRFGGRTGPFYSVAEHCIMVSKIVNSMWAREGLLHDAAEAYLLDIPSPLKLFWGTPYKKLENKYMRVISEKFGLAWPMVDVVYDHVKRADFLALITERENFITDCTLNYGIDLKPLDVVIRPLGYRRAEKAFLKRFNELFNGG